MKKIVWLIILVVALIVVMGACTRSKSSGPGALPTPAGRGDSAFPVMPTSVEDAAATQTAVAAALAPETGGGEPPPTATPMPVPTATPTQPPPPPPTPTAQPPTPKPKPPVVVTRVPSTYTLHRGEFPYCLARRFNIDPDTLLAVNGLSKNQWVYSEGTTLTIPQNAGPFPYRRALRPHPTTYTVQAGDTFYSIACKFGDVWPEAIAAANGMSVNANLTPGLTLHIP